jgi:tRNA A-37 threonylcarbamoyl transferase component Bud32
MQAIEPDKRRRDTCEAIAGELRWEVATDLRDVLLGPDGLRLAEWQETGQARIVKHGPHRTVYHVTLAEGQFHVKHCRLKGPRAWLRESIRPAKARGEYQRLLAVAARGVPTVTPVAIGESCRPGPADSFLVTRSLEAEPLGFFLEETLPALGDPALRQRLAAALGRFVAHLHAAGITHHDLHADNILVDLRGEEPCFYLIDLDAARLGPPLGWRARRRNLVILNRWFVLRASRSERLRFWQAYAESLPFDCARTRAEAARDLEERTWRSNVVFWQARDRRCLEANRRYRPVGSARASGHAVVDLNEDALAALLADPDEPFGRPGVVLLKNSRTSTVAELDLTVDGMPRRVVWKRFRLNSRTELLRHQLVRPPALRSWVFGHGLRERCLPTPRPLLVLHSRRHGLRCEGYLLTEKVAAAEELSRHVAGVLALPQDEARSRLRHLIEQVARLVRALHRRQLAQRDLKAANILVQKTAQGPALWLIDLVGVTRHRRLRRRQHVQNLARLHVSFVRNAALTRTDWLRFLRSYLAWNLHGKEGWKDWWQAIAVATERKVIKNAHNGRILA